MGIILRSFVATLLAFAVLAGILLATGGDEPAESAEGPATDAPSPDPAGGAEGNATTEGNGTADAPQANASAGAGAG